MCYKFVQPTDLGEIQKVFPSLTSYSVKVKNDTVEVMRPGTVIVNIQSQVKEEVMEYGFTNNSGYTYYNARYETVPILGTWQYSYKNKRCIVPMTSFIEGSSGNAKLFHVDEVLYAAGLYNDKNQFCVLTCDALGLVKKTHSRYPLFLNDYTINNWLNTRNVVPVAELATNAVEPIEDIESYEVI